MSFWKQLLKDYSRLDLTCPMLGCSAQHIRQLLVEGSLKLKDSKMSGKIDVHCFLFSDILLVCKAASKKSGGDRVRVVRPPYLLDRLVVQELADRSGFVVVYLNEFKVATALFVLYSSDAKIWLDYIRKAQEQYRHAKTTATGPEAAARGSPSHADQIRFYRSTFDEDDDFDYRYPAMALLAPSSRSSSRSSLVHSHSGSVDSDPLTSASGQSSAMIAPAPTPNLLPNPAAKQPSRAVSFELGELRKAPSLVVEDTFGRSHSVDNRSPPVTVTVTSPRPERRAFLLKSVKDSSPPAASLINSYQNTLVVNVPYIRPC